MSAQTQVARYRKTKTLSNILSCRQAGTDIITEAIRYDAGDWESTVACVNVLWKS